MPFFDIYLREKLTILSRLIWYYDSSGVQAKNYFGSMYEPILFCVKEKKNYTFNSDAILVEAKTGAKRGLIDYRKTHLNHITQKKCQVMFGSLLESDTEWMSMKIIRHKNPLLC